MSAAETVRPDRTGSLPISIPAVAHEFWFACGCLDQDCARAGFQADALPYVVAHELRAVAGDLTARLEVALELGRPMTADDVLNFLLGRANALEES